MHTCPARGTFRGPGRRARQWAAFLARCVLATYHILLVVADLCLEVEVAPTGKNPKKSKKSKKHQKKSTPCSPSNTVAVVVCVFVVLCGVVCGV